ncbi:MAG: 3-deoxy-D-manno-octulosonic acid transferase [Planctomycetes bacterium]|nr:3-deoxy-D-manno-octulosonic acid transferase [Planctomycetota bacterium]
MTALLIDLVYLLALVAISPIWLYRMIRHGRYRRDLRQRLGKAPCHYGTQPVIWVHAVSLGEINAIRTLVDELAGQLPDHQIVISSTTDTGMAQAVKLFSPKRVAFRFPLDFSWAMRRAVNRIRPNMVVLMEGEIWPNLIALAGRRKVPVVLVNGRMSENRGYPRYKRFRCLTKRLFNGLTALAVQDQRYADRFIDLGAAAEKVHVTGTMKFDTAEAADGAAGAEEMAKALGLGPTDRLIVAGGTGPGEEQLLLEMFANLTASGAFDKSTRLAIIPRKPERFDEVADIIARCGFGVVRRSQCPDGTAGQMPASAVVLGDTMGDLRKFYSLAAAAFVGRSLVPMGGSDMIEAVALGIPVAFGPHVFNFPQARGLVEASVARQVADVVELGQVLAQWLADPAAAAELGRMARQFVRSQQGATRRNVEIICGVLGRKPAERPGNIATKIIA